jgi:hypothetical protein
MADKKADAEEEGSDTVRQHVRKMLARLRALKDQKRAGERSEKT